MDAFEEIVAGLFRHGEKKYWTWLNYKIDLTKDEKVQVENYSMPRPEIDILAYRPADNEVLWIECKSYLNSPGLRLDHFINGTGIEHIPKVFVDSKYREVVTKALLRQLDEAGLAHPAPVVHYYLVAGNIHGVTPGKFEEYSQHFREKGWTLWGLSQIQKEIDHLKGLDYENDVAIMMAKLMKELS
ncbi:MAG: hypothetical protein ACYDBJ_23895 [Aggregatilineales bacterium]